MFASRQATVSGAGMKIHFHATDGERHIRDEKGIEVADVKQAREQTLRALTEFRREVEQARKQALRALAKFREVEQTGEQAQAVVAEYQRELEGSEDGLSGWRLQVVDAAGLVLFTLDLD
jgi:hypothetical protein